LSIIVNQPPNRGPPRKKPSEFDTESSRDRWQTFKVQSTDRHKRLNHLLFWRAYKTIAIGYHILSKPLKGKRKWKQAESQQKPKLNQIMCLIPKIQPDPNTSSNRNRGSCLEVSLAHGIQSWKLILAYILGLSSGSKLLAPACKKNETSRAQ